MERVKKVLRSLQTNFPFLHDIRFRLKLGNSRRTKKPHDADFAAMKLFNPASDDVFVDVGANRGESIQSMLNFDQFDNKIVAFEPNELIFNNLKNYFNINPRVEIHNIGLGKSDLQSKLYIPFYKNWMFDGLSSFKKEEAEEWLKTRFWNFKEKHLTIKESSCQIKTLDSFGLKAYFVKVDVQGYEFDVLLGAKETIKNHEPIFLIESIDEKSIKFLDEFGYQFYSFNEPSLINGIGSLNTWCLTKKRIESLRA